MRALAKLMLMSVVVAAIWLAWAILAPIKPGLHTYVTIKAGSNTRQIGASLEQAGIIHSRTAFLIFHAFTGRRTLKAGEYEFIKPASLPDVYSRLARGDVFTRTVVIPEGFNIYDIASALEEAHLCSREDFIREASVDTKLIADLAPHAPSLEGFLFPDTYQFGRNQSPQEIAATMVKRFRQEAKLLGLTTNVSRTITMASFVEKETRLSNERPIVAGVFENRLKMKMALATDPSVIYAAELAGGWKGVIHQSDLQRESPYNTYKYAGLPPGPIANPGRDAIAAAMHPAPTPYLYFVADNTGGHNFARTIDQHNKNVAAFRKGIAKHMDR